MQNDVDTVVNEALSFGVAIPFVDHLGFELRVFEAGLSELVFEPRPEHLNSFAVTHGGALMTLLDVTMAVAARSVQKDMGAVTIEMKTSFMQPARGKLTSKGHLMHRTATMAFTEGTVFDEAGRACAHATGTFKFVKRLATGPKSVNALNVTAAAISTD
ncbi:MAG: PaaI family thioesterase [Rhodoferax sp.]|uniref:PaaI family thioesterase n=1 Tax=Rhodoferax sp. TaxID=50421 RepID=UPI0017992B7C|nr:PaaI family thioesterase [Rhodoferax sp.]NMM15406.1 PaaI family thioesterase [Rhodoferax sp.]NMM21108.1 PaaI family thioesterase [Rhodoferax sp.]